MWYDMGEFATAAYVLGIAHNTGYPLLMLLGKLFTLLPVGDVAYRVNLMSAAFGALTVLMLYVIVFELAGRHRHPGAGHSPAGTPAWRVQPQSAGRIPAAVAALSLAFSSTLWSNATWATSYDLNAFLTLLVLWLTLRWRRASGGGSHSRQTVDWTVSNAGKTSGRWLNAAALALGLGLGNHRLILGAAQAPPVSWADPSQLDVLLRMVTTGYARAFVNPFESWTTCARC